MVWEGETASRIGAKNFGSNKDELFLKVFSGEVLTTFEENNIMMPLHRVRTISSGKTAQFPTTGVAEAKYHNPGESLFGDEYNGSAGAAPDYLSRVRHSEVTIAIDGVLTASAFLADIDEAKNHYEVRSIYSTEIGRQLAYYADKAVIRTIIGGARATTGRFGAITAGGEDVYGGAQLNVGTTGPNAQRIHVTPGFSAVSDRIGGDADGLSGLLASAAAGPLILDAIFTAATLMDQKNVPSQGRYCVLPPQLYYKLVQGNFDAINRDYGNDGNGSVAQGNIVSVCGIRVLKSNHVPNTNESSDPLLASAQVNNDPFNSGQGYGAAFGLTCGLIFQTEAAGTVKLMDLAMESEYFMERLGTLMMAKYAMGHDVLRHECCYEIINDSAAG
jgi:hypothetical protein